MGGPLVSRRRHASIEAGTPQNKEAVAGVFQMPLRIAFETEDEFSRDDHVDCSYDAAVH
jgi:hypothetical protein